LREALAAANHDMLLDDDSREQKRRAGRGGKPTAASRLFGGRRRAMIFLSLAALTAIGIPLNALYLQDGRHPAPLFRKGAAEPEARHARVETPPAPPPRPPIAEPAPEAPAPKPAATKAEPAHPAEKHRGDAIGALIGGAAKTGESEKNIRQAQQALAKMGYPVQTDGVMGAATRRALEKFERANGLPADGALDAAVLRRLRARAASAAATAPTHPAVAAHPAPPVKSN
jgi:hypothetical protein